MTFAVPPAQSQGEPRQKKIGMLDADAASAPRGAIIVTCASSVHLGGLIMGQFKPTPLGACFMARPDQTGIRSYVFRVLD